MKHNSKKGNFKYGFYVYQIIPILFIFLIYIVLSILCIKTVLYLDNIEGLLFWFTTLTINILISFFLRINILKFVYLKSFITTIIFNFFFLGITLFLTARPFRIYPNSDTILLNMKQIIMEITFSGNWLIPLIVLPIKKLASRVNKNV